MNKQIHVLGGGLFQETFPHFAGASIAFGGTARRLVSFYKEHPDNKMDTILHLSKMADPNSKVMTYDNFTDLVASLAGSSTSRLFVVTNSIPDFRIVTDVPEGVRPLTSNGNIDAVLVPNKKVINSIRKERKDLFLVTCKQTFGATEEEMFLQGIRMMKNSSSNLVLANDSLTGLNMILTPEESSYCITKNRDEALRELVDMSLKRSHLTFTRSTVVAGEAVAWESDLVPANLRDTVNWCIEQGAYKSVVESGATVGHFAIRLSDTEFLTSKRKTNFNQIKEHGLVYVKTDGPDSIIAYGSKPSVGGQSQRIIFGENPGLDCIVHFHCPLKENHRDNIRVMSQREFECGSHGCGINTANGLLPFGNLKAVMLDKHGPNIVFGKDTKVEEVIDFIQANFDLSKKTTGLNYES